VRPSKLLLMAVLLALVLVLLPASMSAQEPAAAASQAAWQYGPASPFHYARHDAVFVPGPDAEPWANKVYLLGGRTSSSTELPDIWMFDPVAGTYTDTGADMVEDVSNYNGNLIMDDGTGRGPAIYVIGGYDRDVAAANIGTVQRYYPQTNECEALATSDDWPVSVAGYKVGAMGTAVVNEVIYVFGGWESAAPPYFYGGTWTFDPMQPSGSRWTDLGVNLTPARGYIQAASQGGLIYAIGGIYQYVGGDLVPTDAVEVLDTANPGAGWATLTSLPLPAAEGRAVGFEVDTLGRNSPWEGKLVLVGAADWPGTSLEVIEYDIGLDTWDLAFPDLNEDRVSQAVTYVPLCTPDPDDGLPGIWVFGGRWDSG
jgi:hypothetical protein